MTTTTWPHGSVTTLAALGALGDPVSRENGESKGIYPVSGHGGLLAKIYKNALDASRTAALDHMITIRNRAQGADLDLIDRSVSWPIARVTDGKGGTVGCVIPEAPTIYRGLKTPDGRQRYLEVDLLAKGDGFFAGRGLTAPTAPQRAQICRSIAAVAALLERNGLVYSDWSYSNAFWSSTQHTAYVIDVDGSQVGSKANIFQPNWDDPLTPTDHPADVYTDRYRAALLVARCLTGRRELAAVVHALSETSGPTSQLLLDVLLATDRAARPTASALHAATCGRPYLAVKIVRRAMPAKPVPQAVVPVIISGGRPGGPPAKGGKRIRRIVIAGFVLTMLVCAIAVIANN